MADAVRPVKEAEPQRAMDQSVTDVVAQVRAADPQKTKEQARVVGRLRIAFWSSGIFLLWMTSAYFLIRTLRSRAPIHGSMPTVGDLAAIFFGASSIALIFFSLILAIAALIQWQSLKGEVQETTEAARATVKRVNDASRFNEALVKNLEEKTQRQLDEFDRENQRIVANLRENTQKQVEALEKELRGRIDAVMGATIGSLHSNPAADTQSLDDEAYLSEAIYHAQRGYDRLRELPGNGKYVALNSIVYFSCLLGSQAKRDLLIEQGRELREIGRKYEHLSWSAPYLLTSARVALVYQSDDRAELQQALGIVQDLSKARLTSLQEREATYLVDRLSRKLAAQVQ